MTNEAAERLRRYLALNVPEDEALADLDEALADERRATVERIRKRLTADGGFRFEARGEDVYAAETLFAILDEEASR